MKLAVFSDTHGSTEGMLRAARQIRPDVLVHLGDHISDAAELREAFPDIPLHCVPGNCDFMSRMPENESFMAGPVSVLATHGHRYSVKFGIDSLLNAAHFSGAKLVLYGHTHIANYEQVNGMHLLNPGAAGRGTSPTFALVDIAENGGISVEIKYIEK